MDKILDWVEARAGSPNRGNDAAGHRQSQTKLIADGTNTLPKFRFRPDGGNRQVDGGFDQGEIGSGVAPDDFGGKNPAVFKPDPDRFGGADNVVAGRQVSSRQHGDGGAFRLLRAAAVAGPLRQQADDRIKNIRGKRIRLGGPEAVNGP